MALISYLGILCIIPLFFKKDEGDFVMFHARQGFLVLLGEIATFLLFSWNPLAPLMFLLNLVWLVMSVIGIMNVANDEKKVLPFIGQYADRIKI
jgi:uncharacterized membrane protein